MCAEDKIPEVGRFGLLGDILEATPHEAQDIYALDLGSHITADFIVDLENGLVNNLNVSRVRETLLDEGRVPMPYQLSSDYENIFEQSGLSRRSQREVPSEGHRPSPDGEDLIGDWAYLCLEDPSQSCDHLHPGDMEAWHPLMENDIPTCLNGNSWIAGLMIRIAFDILNDEIDGLADIEYTVREWEEWMGPNEVRWQKFPDGMYRDMLCFIGEAKPGHLVWKPKIRFPLPFGHGRGFCDTIRKQLRQAEMALVALARRIARHVACCVVYGYSLPEFERRGFGILNRRQVGCAVKEILGEAWFDLPFDTDGSLRNWSEDDVLKPDDEMHDLHVFIGGDCDMDDTDDEEDIESVL